MNKQNEMKYALAIVCGFALIAGALLVKAGAFTTLFANEATTAERVNLNERHTYGDTAAKVTLVEFSDFECPYCGQLHETLKRIVDESNGSIKWEFRHMPLPIHKDAKIAAYYSECVSSITDDEGFFTYADTLMQNQRSIDVAYLEKVATEQGIKIDLLHACISDAKTIEIVAEDTKTGQRLGGTGTPFTVIVYADGTQKSVSGAVPYEQWKKYLSL